MKPKRERRKAKLLKFFIICMQKIVKLFDSDFRRGTDLVARSIFLDLESEKEDLNRLIEICRETNEI